MCQTLSQQLATGSVVDSAAEHGVEVLGEFVGGQAPRAVLMLDLQCVPRRLDP